MGPITGVLPGLTYPLGSTVMPGGVNFAVWARPAEELDLLLFDDVEHVEPASILRMPAEENRTFYYWHAFVPGLQPGQLYAFRARSSAGSGPGQGELGPYDGGQDDAGSVLLDPYAKAVAIPKAYERAPRRDFQGDSRPALKSVVVDLTAYDWEGDRPLGRAFTRTVIYELHVRGFTAHPNSGLDCSIAGTFAGLVHKIPYLRELGVTAVELMPVLAFDPQDAPAGRVNYWGYSPISFFAVHPLYASNPDPQGVLDEFRTMVKELHRAGIEVILDVVFNHTAEGAADGPTFSWRGLDPHAYYLFDAHDPTAYADFTGCGNTLNANHSVVRRMITDALHHWVADMHVDGFRFDLASVLARDSVGDPMANPPVIWQIESDPVLAGTKLIAEAWDAAGLYQVGSFVGDRWREWNGRFRDDLRDFVRGAPASVARLPNRVLASPDLYGSRPAEVEHAINFITAHDGFTLNDLVSYDRKHNEANGEDNRDGSDWERSWNHGVEGPTDDPAIEAHRLKDIKGLLAVTIISVGCPMLTMGDEARRTQGGNNNAYCQDNETSWFDWSLVDRNADLVRFVRMAIALRLGLDMTTVRHAFTLREFLTHMQVEYHGVRLHQPDWGEDSRTLALTLRGIGGSRQVHVIFNGFHEALDFELPPVDAGHPWRRIIDTALPSPNDIAALDQGPEVGSSDYHAQAHSMVFLDSTLPHDVRPAS